MFQWVQRYGSTYVSASTSALANSPVSRLDYSHITERVHQTSVAGGAIATSAGGLFTCLPGHWLIRADSPEMANVVPSRMEDQLWKVRVNTNSGLWVHWNALLDAGFYVGRILCQLWTFTGCWAPFSIRQRWCPKAGCIFGLSSGGLLVHGTRHYRTRPDAFTSVIGLSISWRGGLSQQLAKGCRSELTIQI